MPDRNQWTRPTGTPALAGGGIVRRRLSFRRRLIAFALVAGLASGVPAQEGGVEAAGEPVWATLSGRIVAEGTPPPVEEERVDRDAGICAVDGVIPKDDNLVFDADGGLRDVFVMMYLRDDRQIPVHPQYEKPVDQPLVLDNLACRFVPHALFVRTGQKLVLKNSDEVGHNCHIITFGNEENVNLSQLSEVAVELKNPDKAPGNVVCDIHKWMDAVILVRDEPYAAISAADGTFSIRNVPPGTWSFQFWHKRGGYLRDLQIGGYEVGRRGEIEVTLEEGKTLDLGTMKISFDKLGKGK